MDDFNNMAEKEILFTDERAKIEYSPGKVSVTHNGKGDWALAFWLHENIRKLPAVSSGPSYLSNISDSSRTSGQTRYFSGKDLPTPTKTHELLISFGRKMLSHP